MGIRFFPDVTLNVGFTLIVNCLLGGSITGSGIFSSASCGRATGSGTFTGFPERPFAIDIAGTTMVLTGPGGLIGTGQAVAVPDTSTVPPGNSCANGTAKEFRPPDDGGRAAGPGGGGRPWVFCADTGAGHECLG